MWRARLVKVNELIHYVANNLPPMPTGKRMNKASQYVYANLMVGKMVEPDGDPLFAACEYDDLSLKSMIGDEPYTSFCKQRSTPLVIADEDPTHPEQLMKLRYQCIGGYHNNLHASITKDVAAHVKDYTECFASPMNHKLDTYHTMFRDDPESKGNFFAFAAQHGDMLPNGKYFLSPPYIEAVYDRLVKILGNSGKDLTAIIIGPDWEDAAFVKQLSDIASTFRYSFTGKRKMDFIHDCNGLKIQLNTYYWIMSGQPLDKALVGCFTGSHP
jgi:hypothetical protein